ncbi:MAG: tetratricopeptide repeat protein, partial [Phycisphaerales bacterium]|nr:tetratricopeptide repeat protein [Phycisphaerales bacterium]
RVALMLLDWAESVTKQGAHDRAAPLLREAVAIAVDLPARHAAVAAQCRLRLGQRLLALHDNEKAERMLAAAVEFDGGDENSQDDTRAKAIELRIQLCQESGRAADAEHWKSIRGGEPPDDAGAAR